MHNLEALERLSEMGDTHAMTELGILFYDTFDFRKSIKLLEAVTHCETLNAIALLTLGRAYAEYNGNKKEITEKVISLWVKASLLGNKEACLCLGMAYHDGYDGKLKIEPDYEKAERWYSEALKLGLKVSLFYLGKLYNNKSTHNVEEAVKAYTYYNYFYVLTSQDKDTFSTLREEAIHSMADIEKSADEINVKGRIFRAFKSGNKHLLDRLSSRLKFS